MTTYLPNEYKVVISTKDYIPDITKDDRNDMFREYESTASYHVFVVNKNTNIISEGYRKHFHNISANILLLPKRLRTEIQDIVEFPKNQG